MIHIDAPHACLNCSHFISFNALEIKFIKGDPNLFWYYEVEQNVSAESMISLFGCLKTTPGS